ncbi:DUF2381 family protein [Melittangium boletus]|uniref:DUF2381 family protein n=1 Tax=Melittangium boletus DSM 14713 TaxID=1294270 RepID=A0A250IMT6_9BACT|nr:DUF2381 family protein [Melittangium boletus]ATB32563.1 hypothetical protein MEBOL_006051 [Melittangium boletus DSM 14713]
MSLPAFPLMLVFSVFQGLLPLGTMDCTEMQHIELSRMSDKPTEVCVSPHLLTGFSFDAPVSVEVQDEIRFEEVARGRTSIHVLPPKDLTAGERLRLSVTYLEGKSQETFFLVLVGSSGRSTRQVEVFRDQRTRESLEIEIKLERTKNQKLQDELVQLRREFKQLQTSTQDPRRLTRLISSNSMFIEGIRTQRVKLTGLKTQPGEISSQRVASYRSRHRFAIEVALESLHPQPWLVVTVEAWDENGQRAEFASIWQAAPLQMKETQVIVVEAEMEETSTWPKGTITLRLREEGPRDIIVSNIPCP